MKAVSELFAPMSGEVVEVNPALKDHPESVNTEPHETWMVRVRLSNPTDAGSLLDSAAYERLIRCPDLLRHSTFDWLNAAAGRTRLVRAADTSDLRRKNATRCSQPSARRRSTR